MGERPTAQLYLRVCAGKSVLPHRQQAPVLCPGSAPRGHARESSSSLVAELCPLEQAGVR